MVSILNLYSIFSLIWNACCLSHTWIFQESARILGPSLYEVFGTAPFVALSFPWFHLSVFICWGHSVLSPLVLYASKSVVSIHIILSHCLRGPASWQKPLKRKENFFSALLLFFQWLLCSLCLLLIALCCLQVVTVVFCPEFIVNIWDNWSSKSIVSSTSSILSST